MNGFPSYVDLEFTARCNLKCGFCFGPADDAGRTPDLDAAFWARAIDAIADRGCAGIVISGGEPTLYPHLKALLDRAKSRGLQTVLSTHGRHEARLFAVAQSCDWIALPVDGYSRDSLVEMRGDGWGLRQAASLAERLKNATHGHVSIKLGSVATRLNAGEIPQLAAALAGLQSRPFDTWKIYQYTPRRKFANRRDLYEISDDAYAVMTGAVEVTGITQLLNTVFSSHAARRRAYLFIYPDGTLAIPNEGHDFSDIVVGNLAHEGEAALDKVRAFGLFLNEQNFETTYG